VEVVAMPKVPASLANVSTEYKLAEPDTYAFELTKCEEKTDSESGRVHYEIDQKIVAKVANGVEEPSEYDGHNIKSFIHIHKTAEKGGGINEVGLAELKRYGLAIVGEERVNDDEFDTDEMINGRFWADVTIEEYKGRKNNRVKNIVAAG
jgi:hypothetical protein